MRAKHVAVAGLLLLLFLTIHSAIVNATDERSTIEDVWFATEDFAAGSGSGFTVTADGLTLADSALTGIYTSPVIEAPLAFNAVVPQWISDVPETSSLEIRLRTAASAGGFGPWHHIHPQPDWMLPEDVDTVGEMIAVPAADHRHQYIQFEVNFSRYTEAEHPLLRQLRLTFIDSTDGPTSEELIEQQKALDASRGTTSQVADSYPKPFVVSREVWCTEPACNYTEGLEYHPVSHLILHHTVSSNSSSDWAATVRAIWRFHTFTRGWGDIGYNYLVDMNGVLYEGHRGGDDVVGTHSGGANTGSMALALLGTFTRPDENPPGISPPPAMLNAAVELFAWKADQRNIDVYDASSALPNIAWGLPHLMGHRDVYGGTNTECPGDQAHALLPWLRQQVYARLGQVSPYIYVDELSNAFTRSNSNWHVAPNGCGNNGHAYYTWSTTNPAESTNWGEWRPNIPGSGRYQIDVYAPYCITGAIETTGATYHVHHAGGVSQIVVNQDAGVGRWMSLGQFDLQAGNNTLIRLTDLTTTDSGQGVWFDAIRLRPINVIPSVTNEQPAPDIWHTQPTVNFVWNVTNPTVVQATTLRVATDAAFNNVILTQTWPGTVTNYIHTFNQDYDHLYWQILLATTTNTVFSNPTHFRLDSTLPTSAIVNIFQFRPGGAYYVFWQGSDNLSGLAGYNIDVRLEGSAAWDRWFTQTTAGYAPFVPPQSGQVYWFRSQAVDVAGNVEAPHPSGELNTGQAILLSHDIMLPMVIQR